MTYLASHSDPQPLDLQHIPLTGRHLIEASAGTGKTWSIANLYLRLLLQPGVRSQPLSPSEILVMTFTNDATSELRHRISQRIEQAIAMFRAVMGGADEQTLQQQDPLLYALAAQDPKPLKSLQQLVWAQTQMDLAPISTIHSFAIRVLQEQAFDSGCAFDVALEQRTMRQVMQLMHTYWREHLYPLQPAQYGWVTQHFSSPYELYAALRPALEYGQAVMEPTGFKTVQEGLEELTSLTAQIKQQWSSTDAVEQLSEGFKLKPSTQESLAALNEVMCSDEATGSDALQYLHLLETGQSAGKNVKQMPVPDCALSQLLWQLRDATHGLRWALLHEARAFYLSQTREQQEQGQLSFNEVLEQLHHAVKRSESSQRLTQLIRRASPVILVDEFQDTDSIQWGIFDAVWPVDDAASHTADSAMYLIGDPKQSIYRFRGAQLEVYLRARQTAQHYWCMGTNYRSNSTAVEAINQLFAQHQTPFVNPQLAYQAVQPSVRADAQRLLVNGQPVAGLLVQHIARADTLPTKGAIEATLARNTAVQIAQLLVLAAQGKAQVVSIDGAIVRAVSPQDIAVLTNTHEQKRLVMESLRDFGVPVVAVSNKQTVFESAVLPDVLLLLQALHAPTDVTVLRQLHACALACRDLPELQYAATDVGLDQLLNHAQQLQLTLQRAGLLAAVRQWLFDLGIPARLAPEFNGQRDITDVVHLAHIAQDQLHTTQDVSVAIRYLQQQASVADQAQDRLIKLDSDVHAVQINTIHGSKGLEYPIVFVPFTVLATSATQDALQTDETAEQIVDEASDQTAQDSSFVPRFTPPSKQHAVTQIGDTGPVINLAPDQEATQAEATQQLAENLRHLYVACTRAVHTTVLTVCDYKKGGAKAAPNQFANCALGYLLQADQASSAAHALAECEDVQVHSAELSLWTHDSLETLQEAVPRPVTDQAVELQLEYLQRPIEDRWRLWSFTALHQAQPSATQPVVVDSSLGAAQEAVNNELSSEDVPAHILRLPGGRRVGSALHSLIERFDFAAIEIPTYAQARVSALRERLQLAPTWDAALVGMLHALSTQPLDSAVVDSGVGMQRNTAASLVLHQVPSRNILRELGFELNALPDMKQYNAFRQEWAKSIGVQVVDAPDQAGWQRTLNGMLTGSLDVLLEHQGQYFVLDYKSNNLGGTFAHYEPQALAQYVFDAGYDLQLSLYAMAVDRYLRHRIPQAQEVQAQDLLGGMLFVFLRGLNPALQAPFDAQQLTGSVCFKFDELWWDGLYEVFESSQEMGLGV